MSESGEEIRVVAIMEAQFVTGPAKNLLEFAQWARSAPNGLPRVNLSIITYHRDPSREPSTNPFVAAAERAGVPVDVIREKGRFDQTILAQITSALYQRKPHLVQTHNSKSHFLMRYSSLYRKFRWIGFHHGHVTTDLKMRLYHQLDRWSLRAASHLVTVCGAFREQLTSFGIPAERITVRHNGIRAKEPAGDEAIQKLRESLPCPAGTPILLMVSRLSHEKGHLDFLNALAILARRGVAAHAVIVGDGPERAPIEHAIARFKLADRVTLAGHQDDVRAYFAAADLYLMPSHSEGSPNALLEAMAARIPIVASDAGGISEIVTNGESAALVPAKDAEALAGAIDRLLKNPEDAARLVENASRESAKFTYDAYGRALIGVYQRVLGA